MSVRVSAWKTTFHSALCCDGIVSPSPIPTSIPIRAPCKSPILELITATGTRWLLPKCMYVCICVRFAFFYDFFWLSHHIKEIMAKLNCEMARAWISANAELWCLVCCSCWCISVAFTFSRSTTSSNFEPESKYWFSKTHTNTHTHAHAHTPARVESNWAVKKEHLGLLRLRSLSLTCWLFQWSYALCAYLFDFPGPKGTSPRIHGK